MRLLIITQKVDKDAPILGFFHQWIIAFSKYCDHVIVICLEKGNYDFPKNVKVLTLGKEEGISRFGYIVRFFRYIWQERKNYDFVFVHMNQVYVLLGGLIWKILGKKVALWYMHKQVSISLRVAEKFVDVIFTASKKSFRLPSKKVVVTGHGIDTDLFLPQKKQEKTKYTIMSVARVSPVKRQFELVKLVHKLHNEFPQVHLMLVGPDHNDEYVKIIRDYINEHDLSAVVSFFGAVSNTDIPPLYASADVLVNISETGSLDKEVLEAISCELPVVTTNVAFKDIAPKGSYVTSINNAESVLRSNIMGSIITVDRDIVVFNHSLTSLIDRIMKQFSSKHSLDTDLVRSLYNSKVPGQFSSEYEYHRWFENDIKKGGYAMTRAIIEKYILPMSFSSYIELGPGAGTWTKLFVEKQKDSNYHLLDISTEMLKLAKAATAEVSNVLYTEVDFLEFDSDKKYDLFFSSRAIEYIPDMDKTIKTIAKLLNSGGTGFIITKMPHYLRQRILKQKVSSFHSGQIKPRDLKCLLKKYGLSDVKIYPVTMNFPLWSSPCLSMFLFKLFYRLPLNPISSFFAESYCVRFSKV